MIAVKFEAIFLAAIAALYVTMSVGLLSVGLSVGWSVSNEFQEVQKAYIYIA